MARLEIEQSRRLLPKSTGLPQQGNLATPTPFISSSLSQLGNTLVGIGADMEAKRRRLETVDHVTNASIQANQDIDIFKREYDNQTTTHKNFAKSYIEEVDAIQKGYIDHAPTEEAKIALMKQFAGKRITEFSSALAKEETLFNNLRDMKWQKSASLVLQSIEADPENAIKYANDVQVLLNGTRSKKLKKQLIKKADEAEAYGLLQQNPARLASKLDNGAFNSLSSDRRKSLKTQAEKRFKDWQEIQDLKNTMSVANQNAKVFNDLVGESILSIEQRLAAGEITPEFAEAVIKVKNNDFGLQEKDDPGAILDFSAKFQEFRIRKKKGKVKSKGDLEDYLRFQIDLADAVKDGKLKQTTANRFMKSTASPLMQRLNKKAEDAQSDSVFEALGLGTDFMEKGFESVEAYLKSVGQEDNNILRADFYKEVIKTLDEEEVDKGTQQQQLDTLNKKMKKIISNTTRRHAPILNMIADDDGSQTPNKVLRESGDILKTLQGKSTAPVKASAQTNMKRMKDKNGNEAFVFFGPDGKVIKVEPVNE